jgi:diguanylate cyclase
MCLLAVLVPFSAFAPDGLLAAMGILDLVGALVLWLLRRRITEAVLQVLIVIAVIATSVFVALAKTYAGAVVGAFPYVWITLYVALFFSRRAVALHTTFVVACFGIALVIGGMDHIASGWIIVSITVAVTALALSSVSAQLRRQAVTDPLTGLLNREGLATAAEREIALADRTGLPLTVAVLDLDDFKAINDHDGHSAGDRVLAETATTWRTGLRRSDVLARSGGDEFVILLPATSAGDAEQLLRRLRRITSVGWSSGMVTWTAGETFDACLIRADRELYRAKAGHGPVRVDGPYQSFLATSRATRSPERTAPSM